MNSSLLGTRDHLDSHIIILRQVVLCATIHHQTQRTRLAWYSVHCASQYESSGLAYLFQLVK